MMTLAVSASRSIRSARVLYAMSAPSSRARSASTSTSRSFEITSNSIPPGLERWVAIPPGPMKMKWCIRSRTSRAGIVTPRSGKRMAPSTRSVSYMLGLQKMRPPSGWCERFGEGSRSITATSSPSSRPRIAAPHARGPGADHDQVVDALRVEPAAGCRDIGRGHAHGQAVDADRVLRAVLLARETPEAALGEAERRDAVRLLLRVDHLGTSLDAEAAAVAFRCVVQDRGGHRSDPPSV